MNQITKIAWDLNEKTENRYQLVYELIEIAKRRISEFKTLSRHLQSTDKIRKFETVLIQNLHKKLLIAKRGKKKLLKRLEE